MLVNFEYCLAAHAGLSIDCMWYLVYHSTYPMVETSQELSSCGNNGSGCIAVFYAVLIYKAHVYCYLNRSQDGMNTEILPV